MATEVRTFDLYNTTKYWVGYAMDGYDLEQTVTQTYYATQYNSNPIGAAIEFFIAIPQVNLNYFWKKYWWDEATYYSNPLVLSGASLSAANYYQPFSESVGTLYYISRFNNLNNVQTKPYSSVITRLIRADISSAIDSFYDTANNLFVANIANIGPVGTDTNPNNGNLIMADTDLTRRITSNDSLTAAVNSAYSSLSSFLPYNTDVIGNLLTPYYWQLSANNEDSDIAVDFNNNNVNTIKQLTTYTLIAD